MATATIGQNTGDTYSGSVDTHIKSAAATTNYGTTTPLETTNVNGGGTDDTFLLIAFAGLSNISAGATVTGATLYLYAEGSELGSTHTIEAFRLLRNWVVGQATWNIYSTGNNWATAGAKGSGTDIAAASSASYTTDGTTGVYFSCTGATLIDDVQKFVNGTYSNYGWLLKRTDGTGAWRSWTAADGTNANRPYLSVTYAASSCAVTGTATASIVEGDIVTGGKTVILTLTGATWVAS